MNLQGTALENHICPIILPAFLDAVTQKNRYTPSLKQTNAAQHN